MFVNEFSDNKLTSQIYDLILRLTTGTCTNQGILKF